MIVCEQCVVHAVVILVASAKRPREGIRHADLGKVRKGELLKGGGGGKGGRWLRTLIVSWPQSCERRSRLEDWSAALSTLAVWPSVELHTRGLVLQYTMPRDKLASACASNAPSRCLKPAVSSIRVEDVVRARVQQQQVWLKLS